MKREEYEEAARQLAELPRAERFEKLIQFPANHLFKVIGKREGFSEVVREALGELGYEQIMFVERPSANGRYASLTFTLSVATGQRLDEIYCVLEKVPGIVYLL